MLRPKSGLGISVAFLFLVMAGVACDQTPIGAQAEPEVHRVATDATGGATIPGTEIHFNVLDLVSDEPVQGVDVTAVVAHDGDALIFVSDPTGDYAPLTFAWSQIRQQSDVSASFLFPVVVRLTREAYSWFAADLPTPLADWYQRTHYNCHSTTLDRLQADFTPDLADFLSRVVVDEFLEFAATNVVGAFAGTTAAAYTAFVFTAVAAWDVTDFAVTSAINFSLSTYRWLGYTGSESFTYCVKKPLAVVMPGPVAFWGPNEPPTIAVDRMSGVRGVVRDAASGTGVQNVIVQLVGPETQTTLSDATGFYEFVNLPTGSYQISAMKAGYSRQEVEFSLGLETRLLDLSLAPQLVGADLRFILTWGAVPRDLDSHLWTPWIDGASYHVYFGSRGNETLPPYASLDRDDVDGFGPETTTIWQPYPGQYEYAVHDYTNRSMASSSALVESGARVEVFDIDGRIAVFDVANVTNPGPGVWWHVFTYDSDLQVLTVVNELRSVEPSVRHLDLALAYTERDWKRGFGR